MANTLKFSTMAHMLIKNTVFESADQQTLTLSLDEKFSNLLTDSIKRTIQDKLQENFGKLSLNISVNKLKTQTLAQKETQAKNEKIAVLQKDFLADKGVQKLQQTFNTKVDINSIKEIKMEARNV
jgi:DNA polymerase-3 subunit gamma/tau